MTYERRAQRLTRVYPRAWRERYGDEFERLLADQMHDGTFTILQTFNVLANGCGARASAVGLRSAHNPRALQRWSPAWAAISTTLFIAFGSALWSQLTIGWQWARPTALGTRGAMWVMSLSMAVFLLVILSAGATFVVRTWRQRASLLARRALAIGAVLFVAGLLAFVVGAIHFSQHWPGTHGHPWSGRGIVPGGVGAFAWSATSSITAYWMHPTALAHFPATELTWMFLSPLALITALVGLGTIVVAVRQHTHFTTPSVWWTRVLGANMMAFLFGALWWLMDGDSSPRNLFHRGLIDVIDVIMMTLSFAWSVDILGRWRRSHAGVATI